MTKLTLSNLLPNRYLRGQNLSKPLLARVIAFEREIAHPCPGVEEQVWVLRFEPLDYPGLKPTLCAACSAQTRATGLSCARPWRMRSPRSFRKTPPKTG